MRELSCFRHHAMATYFEVRIAHEQSAYAAQAAQAAFHMVDLLECQLSRFRPSSDIARLASVRPGQTMRVSQAVYGCLSVAKRMEAASGGAFSVTAAALSTQPTMPKWSLLDKESSVRCDHGVLQFDLGAIGKGFALDRAADVLRTWDCESFLLVAGGSSVLAGEAPADAEGWLCGVRENAQKRELSLSHAALSGSGLAVKGRHILDPRTGRPAVRTERAWALTEVCAESDALSTACMVLSELEIEQVLAREPSWVVFLAGETLRVMGAV